MKNKDKINQYCSYFEEQINKITKIEDHLYQKILLVTIFDTFARSVYPEKKNRDRFIKFTEEYSAWTGGNRISIPQLLFLLQQKDRSCDSILMKEVKTQLEKYQSGNIYRLDKDPSPDDISSIKTIDNEMKLIKSSRHVELFYIYRTYLVHEFREPGYGMSISNDNITPYYHGMDDLHGNNTWELVYPIGFFRNIVKCSLLNLRKYLEENDIDPYLSYEFSSIWYQNRRG